MFTNFKQTKMAAQTINVHRQRSSRDQVDLIEYKEGAGELDFVNRILEPNGDSSWLNMNPRVPSKDISQPPSKEKECKRTEMEHQIVTQRQASEGYLQNRQMGKVCKKGWDTTIAYICIVFAFIAVWINPLRIEAKISMFAHQNLCQWIYVMWVTMIPRALQDFIKTNQIRRKLEWDIKENTALNLIQDFLSDGHLDLEMQRLTRLNHTFYNFIFSTASNVIYHNLKEIQTQESFVRAFNEWQSTAPGGWLPPPPPPGSFQFQVPVEVLQYAPHPPGAMVESKKIDLDLLSEKDRMAILKKQQNIKLKKNSNEGRKNSTKKKKET